MTEAPNSLVITSRPPLHFFFFLARSGHCHSKHRVVLDRHSSTVTSSPVLGRHTSLHWSLKRDLNDTVFSVRDMRSLWTCCALAPGCGWLQLFADAAVVVDELALLLLKGLVHPGGLVLDVLLKLLPLAPPPLATLR